MTATEIVPLLPHFQAALNITTIGLLILAYLHIRLEHKEKHRKFMTLAIAVSSLFLLSYLYYHSQVGYAKFMGQGWIRPIYFTILASHIILAMLVVPLVVIALFYAWRGRFSNHRHWVRWTYPLWVYVSVSGIIVYLLGFHIYPPTAG